MKNVSASHTLRMSAIVLFVLGVAAMAACSGGGSANNQSEVKPEPIAGGVAPEFQEQAKVLDRYCISRPDEWNARVRVLIADVEARTEKKLTPQQLYDEAVKLAPELVNDKTIERAPDGKYDCVTLLTRAVWSLVPELAPPPKPTPEVDSKPEEEGTPQPKNAENKL